MSLFSFAAVCLPYVIQKHGEVWQVLNREYLPLGCASRNVATGAAPIRFKGLTKKRLAKIAVYSRGEAYWLYNDGCAPQTSAKHMNAYLKRLAVLRPVKVEPWGHGEVQPPQPGGFQPCHDTPKATLLGGLVDG